MTLPAVEIHLLNATGALRPVMSFLQARIRSAYEAAAGMIPLAPVDVVVQAGPEVVRPLGHAGYCPAPDRIFVTVDPENPALLADENRAFERMMAHELHHAVRWAGPGYGATLGEVLVSEGLACRFEQELYGPPAPIYARADKETLDAFWPRAVSSWDAPHDHPRWFMGSGDLPVWIGHALGSRIVAWHLSDNGGSAAADVHTPAAAFRPAS